MSVLKKITSSLADELRIFNGYYRQKINTKIQLLTSISNYFHKSQGKKVRPILVMVSAQIFGTVNERTYTAATLIEILHNATLIHDDIVDEAYERRGRLTLHTIWSTKIAVLVGDYLLAKGLLIAMEKKEYQMLEKISEVVKEMSEGELLQSRTVQKKQINKEIYLAIITKKTAKLIEACLYCGTVSVCKNESYLSTMTAIGKHAGIVFQIKDDILDFQSNKLIGKTQYNDIKNGKITLPMILSYQNSKRSIQTKMKKLYFKKNKTKNDIREIISFIQETKGVEASESVLKEHLAICHKLLNTLPDNERRKNIEQLIQYFATRSH